MTSVHTKILIASLAAKMSFSEHSGLMAALAKKPGAVEVAQTLGNSKLVRELRLTSGEVCKTPVKPEFKFPQVTYQGQVIGETKILYKSPLPGELQARLAIESAIERFLEYLRKQYQIVVLNESDRHVQVFIPNKPIPDFAKLWNSFLQEIAFSAYGNSKLQLPGLAQTFIVMLNAVTLSGRGFSTLDVPILKREQADVLAAWYLAVVHQVGRRQRDRQNQINALRGELESLALTEKERHAKEKDLDAKVAMQVKEAKKYTEYFEKSFGKILDAQSKLWEELKQIDSRLADSALSKKDQRKLQKQREKITSKLIFPEEFLNEKREMLREVECNPFELVFRDCDLHPEKFQPISELAKRFGRKATDQINSTRGDIFSQCITEMYRLLELDPKDFDPLPPPLLSEAPPLLKMRSPGDDSKEFCYACGADLDPKTANWQVLRFMFERPSQRRQSSSSEGRPHICASCSALAFASPLKVTDESVILRLEPIGEEQASVPRIKDYVRMLTNKELHLSAGKYVVLASDRSNKGDLAAPKLGQVQYAMAKVASIFPQEVLTDFKFQLVLQGKDIVLLSRHLIFIRGLMESYGQSIIVAGKDINMSFGDAVRYIQQDLPYLAEYTLVKISSIANRLKLEKTRSSYWEEVKGFMSSNSQLSKRARLYQDVAALTGLAYAFVYSLEKTAQKSSEQTKDPKYAAREVSKIIEKADDATAFCYYATLGDEKKTRVEARLYHNPDNDFIYSQTLNLLTRLSIADREEKDDQDRAYLKLFADDVSNAYMYFAKQDDYAQDKGWKELTYNLKLSLYTRFPELVRKLQSKSDN